jgi:hypothetical protein
MPATHAHRRTAGRPCLQSRFPEQPHTRPHRHRRTRVASSAPTCPPLQGRDRLAAQSSLAASCGAQSAAQPATSGRRQIMKSISYGRWRSLHSTRATKTTSRRGMTAPDDASRSDGHRVPIHRTGFSSRRRSRRYAEKHPIALAIAGDSEPNRTQARRWGDNGGHISRMNLRASQTGCCAVHPALSYRANRWVDDPAYGLGNMFISNHRGFLYRGTRSTE